MAVSVSLPRKIAPRDFSSAGQPPAASAQRSIAAAARFAAASAELVQGNPSVADAVSSITAEIERFTPVLLRQSGVDPPASGLVRLPMKSCSFSFKDLPTLQRFPKLVSEDAGPKRRGSRTDEVKILGHSTDR
jgi:hypothetical protein